MVIRAIDFFASIIHRVTHRRVHSQRPSWKILPLEIKAFILELVNEFERTSLINRECREISQTDLHYRWVLKRFADCPALAPFQPTRDLDPPLQVYEVFLRVMHQAFEKKVDLGKMKAIPHHYYSVAFLTQVIFLYQRKEKITFFRSIDRTTFHYIDSTPDEVILACYERFSRAFAHPYPDIENLDLWNRNLTHLPSEIGLINNLATLDLSENQLRELPSEMRSLTRLTTLNLSSNPLLPANVLAVCRTLPALTGVIVAKKDTALIEMFRAQLSQINLIIPTVIVISEPI